MTKYSNHEIHDKKKKEERIAKKAKLDESQEEKLDIVQPKNESSADTKVPRTTS